MKILLVSDSHRDNDSLALLIKKHPNMTLYLHAGDSEASEFEISPFISVKGNCDFFYSHPDYRLIPTDFGPLLIAHKPSDVRKRISQYQPVILVYGHTHVPAIEVEGTRAFINPGSIAYPRSKYGSTYMVLEIEKSQINIKLYSLDEDTLIGEKTIKK